MRSLPLVLVLLAAPLARAALDFDGAGPETVGITTVVFTKTSETTGAPRVLETSIWYPAVPGTGTREGNVFRDAAVRKHRWPLIVFSHGLCAFPFQSPFYTAGLARWGFIVVAPPHPGSTIDDPACDSAPSIADALVNRPADVRFVIDQMLAAAKQPRSPFFRAVAKRKIGMTGHSFGGWTTLRVAEIEPRIRGALALSPVTTAPFTVTDPIKRPAMVMTGEIDSLTPFETDARAAFALLRGPRFLIELLKTGHCGFAVACVPD